MLTVKKLAQSVGVSDDLSRHYTECGLLNPMINTENHYRFYDEEDFLCLSTARSVKNLGFSLSEVKDYLEDSAQERIDKLRLKKQGIEENIEELIKLKNRIEEVENYLSLTKLCNGTVKDVRRDSIHSIYTYSASKIKAPDPRIVKSFSELFPYTHISIKIPLEELNDPNFQDVYSVQLGLGLIAKYARGFNVDTAPPVESIPEGRFLIIYLKTRDILSLSPEEIRPLLNKAKELGKSFTHQSSGRLLAMERDEKGFLYSILIRVRIGD